MKWLIEHHNYSLTRQDLLPLESRGKSKTRIILKNLVEQPRGKERKIKTEQRNQSEKTHRSPKPTATEILDSSNFSLANPTWRQRLRATSVSAGWCELHWGIKFWHLVEIVTFPCSFTCVSFVRFLIKTRPHEFLNLWISHESEI